MRGYIPPSTSEEAHFFKRAEEICRRSSKTGQKIFSTFLDLRQRELFCARLNKYKGLQVRFYPGFQGDSERCIACVWDGFDPVEDWEYPISIIRSKIYGDEKLTHRDFLGAIMSLKIKREFVGDILIEGDECYIVCHSTMAPILIEELLSVRHSSVSFELCDEPIVYTREFSAQKSVTVASLRLDAVVGAVLNTSRSEASSLVRGGAVSVNHLEMKKGDFEILDGDILSIRGKGKFRLSFDGGKSRKDRFFITFYKY